MSTIPEQIELARKTATSPLDFQACLAALLMQQIDSNHSDLMMCMAPDEMCRNIAAFHEKFGLPYDGGPRSLDPEMQVFRIRTMHEELHEYETAVRDGDLAQQFDALIDLTYFVLGTAYLQGFPFRRGWLRVHAANMAKVRATADVPGKRNSKLDVVKPKGWAAPDLSDLVNPS